MASPIYLGNQQMAEHGLAYDLREGSAWSGTFGVGGVALFAHTPTIKNPSGAAVFGHTTLTCYVPSVGSIQGATWIDGVFQTGWGHAYPPTNSYHTRHAFSWWTPALTVGQHNVQVGIYVYNGQVAFDGNDGGTSLCWEQP